MAFDLFIALAYALRERGCMEPRLFVLNLPYFFSESKVCDILKECGVTSIRFARTVHGVLASIQTLTEDDLVKAETILEALKLPAPLGIVRADTLMGRKLDETLRHIAT